MGRDDDTVALVRELVAGGPTCRSLIDADGLYALGTDLELLAGRTAPTVLTPHEGELARLLGRSADEVAARRLELRARGGPAQRRDRAAQGRAHASSPTRRARAFVVPTGNPGLATPGTGDVLTGIVAGQLAKGLPATDAACLGGLRARPGRRPRRRDGGRAPRA